MTITQAKPLAKPAEKIASAENIRISLESTPVDFMNTNIVNNTRKKRGRPKKTVMSGSPKKKRR